MGSLVVWMGRTATRFFGLAYVDSEALNESLDQIDTALEAVTQAGGPPGPPGPAGPTGPPGPGGGVVQSAVVDLTAAQIATLNSAPVTLVVAQGANTVVVPISAFVQYVAGTEPFQRTVSLGLLGAAAGATPTSFGSAFPFDVVVSGGQMFDGGFNSTILTPGVFDNAPLQLSTAVNDPAFTGSILTSALNAGGSGYAPGDTGTITADGPAGGVLAVYQVDTVDGGGGVLTYHLTNNGTRYITGTAIGTTITTGGGDDVFSVDINSITPLSDGVARVQVLYYVMTLR